MAGLHDFISAIETEKNKVTFTDAVNDIPESFEIDSLPIPSTLNSRNQLYLLFSTEIQDNGERDAILVSTNPQEELSYRKVSFYVFLEEWAKVGQLFKWAVASEDDIPNGSEGTKVLADIDKVCLDNGIQFVYIAGELFRVKKEGYEERFGTGHYPYWRTLCRSILDVFPWRADIQSI